MKRILFFLFLFFSVSSIYAQGFESSQNPSCATNCDLLKLKWICGDEKATYARFSFIGPYESGSFFINKNIVVYAYNGNQRLGTYYAKNCYGIDNNEKYSYLKFNENYSYHPGGSYKDILIEFQPIPSYATNVSIVEPYVNSTSTPWHWKNISIYNISASRFSSSNSHSQSSGGRSSSSSSSGNSSGLIVGGVLIGLAAIAADFLFGDDDSSSSSSSSSYNDLYISASDIQSTNSYCTLNDLHFYSYKNADYEYSTIILENGHDYILYKLRNTSSSSRYFIYVYDIGGKKSSFKRYYATSRDAIEAIEKMDCRFCKWFKNKKGRNATYLEFNDWRSSR